ncbi:MAG: hypothetical protein ABWW69_06270 [Pyrodictiaceae archaeon]
MSFLKLIALIIMLALAPMTIYALLWLADYMLPPLYYSGSAPTNPTLEGSLWLNVMLEKENYTVIHIANWSSSIIAGMLKSYNVDRVLILVIAPEKPYTCDEAKRLLDLARGFREALLVVASEDIIANSLLTCIGVPAAITGQPLLRKAGDYEEYLVPAVFKLSGKSYRLVLNLASSIIILSQKNGWNMSIVGVSLDPKAIVGVKASKTLGETNITLYIISDSFPFTNLAKLVERKLMGQPYTSLINALLGGECNRSCLVVFDVSKYHTITEILSSPSLASKYSRTMDRAIALIASSMHPSVWLPLSSRLFSMASERIVYYITRDPTVYMATFSVLLISTYIVISRIASSSILRNARYPPNIDEALRMLGARSSERKS